MRVAGLVIAAGILSKGWSIVMFYSIDLFSLMCLCLI